MNLLHYWQYKITFLIALLAFCFATATYGQIWVDGKEHNIKEIDIQQLLGLAGADILPSGQINPNKFKVKPKRLILSKVLINAYFDVRTQGYLQGLKLPTSIEEIAFYNCHTNETFGITVIPTRKCSVEFGATRSNFNIDSNIKDSLEVYIVDSEITNLNLLRSTSLELTIINSKINREVNIEGTQFQSLDVSGSTIAKFLIASSDFKGYLKPDPYAHESKYWVNYLFFGEGISKSLIDDLVFSRCTFSKSLESGSSFYEFLIRESVFKNLVLKETNFPALNLNGTTIEKTFTVDLSTIDNIGTMDFDLPRNFGLTFRQIMGEKMYLSDNSILDDYQISVKGISGKDSVRKTYRRSRNDTAKVMFATTQPYKANNATALSDGKRYSELINSYTKFLKAYRDRGDTESANLCYIEMKQIEGRRLKVLYDQAPTLERYFAWKLNLFLYWFCDYGTNPVKSLVYACYVIVWFSMLYFLFPSEQDNLTRKNVYSFFSKAVEYFKTDKQLTQIHQEERQHEIDALEKFTATIRESKGTVPPIVWYLGSPLYRMGIIYNRLSIWVLSKSDIVKGRWEDLTKGKKIRLGTMISLYFIGFLMAGLFMRILNALALSLNAFVTLGYGEISAKGISRYLAVLEGVTGWFLLSIFSVSLISQILS